MNAAAPSLLPLRHLLLGLLVVLAWGTNFVVIKLGLADLPPLLFAALRFALAAFPAVLLVRRPQAGWGNLAAYGVLLGAGMFGLLFVAMTQYISPGLASLLAQMQVFFTIGLAMAVAGERLRPFQWVALLLALAGMGLIGWHAAQGGDAVRPLGLALVLLAALCWAGANMVSRAAGQVDVLGYMVWSSVFAVPPLALMSLWLEGWPAVRGSLAAAGWGAWAAVLWQSAVNVIFGYGAWAWLLARHPAASVTPLALLVPVVGMTASSFWLGEEMPAWKWLAAALVLAGLSLNVLWPRLRRALLRR